MGYCLGSLTFDWETSELLPITSGEYERLLDNFLGHDPGTLSHRGLNILVLVGGIGTGKSTALKQAWTRLTTTPRKCSRCPAPSRKCHETPFLVDLNLGSEGPPDEPLLDASGKVAYFWNTVAVKAEELITNAFDFDREVAFWGWCLEHSSFRDRSIALHSWLAANEFPIRAALGGPPYLGWDRVTVMEALARARGQLISTLAARDLAWYRILQVAYHVRTDAGLSCHCAYLFLDNVDHQDPVVQTTAVEFVVLLSSLMPARTVIAIRPYTWQRAVHGQILIPAENHYSPKLHDVLTRRLEYFEQNAHCPPSVTSALRRLVDILTGPHTTAWTEMFDATSGLSVRLALKHFANLTESPLLPPIGDEFAPLQVASTFARAFFFGNAGALSSDAFDNLYAIRGDSRRSFRLVKARILEFILHRPRHVTELDTLASYMRGFGYTDDMITGALSDLLLRARPLLWCQEGTEPPCLASHAKIALTPLGQGYLERLFGEIYYDEVCLARSKRADVNVVFELHRELWEQEKEEIAFALTNRGNQFYMSLYPRERIALCMIHSRNMSRGVDKRRLNRPLWFDPQREEFLRAEVLKMLSTSGWTA